MADFLEALDEVKPAFGAVIESLESYRLHGKGRLGACACPARWTKIAALLFTRRRVPMHCLVAMQACLGARPCAQLC